MSRPKNTIMLTSSLLLMCILTGCCRIASTKEICKYADKTYGANVLVNFETTDKSNTCYFLDKKDKFNYKITSFIYDANMDGTKLGDAEAKSSDFAIQYLSNTDNILNNDYESIAKKHNVLIEIPNREAPECSNILLKIITNSEIDGKQAAEELIVCFFNYDHRKILNMCNFYINIRNSDNMTIGNYDYNNNKYTSYNNRKD